jgi:hypothetical protein
VRRLYIVLCTAITFHTVYWLFFSVGTARYVLICLVLCCAALGLPFLVVRSRRVAAIYVAAIIVAFLGTTGRVASLMRQTTRTGFSASQTRASQQRVIGFLEQHADLRPFGARWWAPIADLEYLSSGAFNFAEYASLGAGETPRRFLLVTNTTFDTDLDGRFLQLLASCGTPALAAPPYAIYQCGGDGSEAMARIGTGHEERK